MDTGTNLSRQQNRVQTANTPERRWKESTPRAAVLETGRLPQHTDNGGHSALTHFAGLTRQAPRVGSIVGARTSAPCIDRPGRAFPARPAFRSQPVPSTPAASAPTALWFAGEGIGTHGQGAFCEPCCTGRRLAPESREAPNPGEPVALVTGLDHTCALSTALIWSLWRGSYAFRPNWRAPAGRFSGRTRNCCCSRYFPP